ncbi:DUF6497 family protein [Tabrizicola oligotrophica]|uniref:Acetolactate synthase n=1 Tax=Tabrizicola oligotrophica TaxID=2710650 RepID=A0A6M0QVK2_9RHOB|nr:DUF6497 family protein [Tabrizicola oligotrophica]NEY91455.1 acetolactate synthase [Tabrizicola oligotrophica]
MGDQGQIWQVQSGGGQTVPGDGLAVSLPSGQTVTLVESIWNAPGPMGLVTRFRFLAPEINPATGSVGFDLAAQDIAWLCQNYALERVMTNGPLPAQVIVSLEDRPVAFGEADPEATQFFEAFRIEDGSCIWEVF